MDRARSALLRTAVSAAAVAGSVACMCFPCVRMTFAPAPGESTEQFYAAFRSMPWGYGNWFPMLSFLSAAAALVLLVIGFFHPVRIACIVCIGVSAASMLLSWACFGTFTVLATGAVACGFVAEGLLLWRRRP